MLQSVGVGVLIALVGVNFVECGDLTFDYGPALDCRSSAAAASPTLAKQICRKLVAKVGSQPAASLDDELEEAAFGCACGLSTHNLCFKGLTTNAMVRMLDAAEEFVSKPVPTHVTGFKGMAAGNTYDKIRFLAGESQFKELNGKTFLPLFRRTYYDAETGLSLPEGHDSFALAEEIAQNSCHHLLNNPFFKGFIKPSLAAIKSTMGKRAGHAVIASQADLLQVMKFANICKAFIEAQLHDGVEY